MQRAQDLYCLFPEGEATEREGQRVGKRLSDGTEVFLFHARFPADRRQKREEALKTFGEGGRRDGRKILIATQVDVQESLRERLEKALETADGEAFALTRRSLVSLMTLRGMIQRDLFSTTKTSPACIGPSWPRPGLAKTRSSLSRCGRKTVSVLS